MLRNSGERDSDLHDLQITPIVSSFYNFALGYGNTIRLMSARRATR